MPNSALLARKLKKKGCYIIFELWDRDGQDTAVHACAGEAAGQPTGGLYLHQVRQHRRGKAFNDSLVHPAPFPLFPDMFPTRRRSRSDELSAFFCVTQIASAIHHEITLCTIILFSLSFLVHIYLTGNYICFEYVGVVHQEEKDEGPDGGTNLNRRKSSIGEIFLRHPYVHHSSLRRW